VKIGDLKFLVDAIGRQFGLAATHSGDGDGWTYTAVDGSTTRYRFDAVKSMDDWTTDVLGVLKWLWDAKDWIKARLPPAEAGNVETHVNNTPALALCADLANLTKHVRPREGKSGRWPTLGPARRIAPQESIAFISAIGDDELTIGFQHPELIEFRLPVLDRRGVEFDDAGDVAQRAWQAWRDFMSARGLLK